MAVRGDGIGDGIPRAHVVRDGSAPIPRMVLKNSMRATYRRAEPSIQVGLSYLVGLWPLVAIVLIAGALLWTAGYQEPTLGH